MNYRSSFTFLALALAAGATACSTSNRSDIAADNSADLASAITSDSNPAKLRAHAWSATYSSSHVPGLNIEQTLTFTEHGTLVNRVDCPYSETSIGGADLYASYEFAVNVDESSVGVVLGAQNETTDSQTGHLCVVGLAAGALAYTIGADGHLQMMGHDFHAAP